MLADSMLMAAGGEVGIGDPYGGGFLGGKINYGSTIYNIVVAPKATGEATRQWKNIGTSDAGTFSAFDGWANTLLINDASHPAAQFCRGLSIGGFTDWYLPAPNELEILYYNLKPATTANNTGSGANPNAIPPRSNHTALDPTQTVAAAFKTGGAEAFTEDFYFSSQQNASPTLASSTRFSDGFGPVADTKTTNRLVRAIRRVAV